MDVILPERVGKLGHMGDTVRVKDGYARNFLLPRGKALRATEANKKKFESPARRPRSAQPRAQARRRRAVRQARRKTFVIIRQAGETGQLYGSVSARDIAEALTAAGLRFSAAMSPSSTDQDARPAPGADPSPSRSRGQGHVNVARSPSRPNVRRRAKTSPCASRPRWTTSVSRSARRSRKPAPARAWGGSKIRAASGHRSPRRCG